jgi:hypothetical protein
VAPKKARGGERARSRAAQSSTHAPGKKRHRPTDRPTPQLLSSCCVLMAGWLFPSLSQANPPRICSHRQGREGGWVGSCGVVAEMVWMEAVGRCPSCSNRPLRLHEKGKGLVLLESVWG